MPDDFSLDPLQIQEDELTRQQARITANRLRQPPALTDAVGQAMRGFNDASGAVAEQQISGKRKALGDQYQASLVEALRDAPNEIKALVLSPGTRKEGLELLKKHHNMRQSDQEMEKYMPGGKFGGGVSQAAGAPSTGGGGGIDYATATRMELSSDPTIAARGKAIREQMKPQDPSHTTRIGANGQVETMPNALEALAARDSAAAPARDKMVPIPDGQGGTKMVSEQQWLASQRGGSALPSATGALDRGSIPPPVAGPSNPPSAPSALPNATGAASPGASAPPVNDKLIGTDPLLQHIPTLEMWDPKRPVNPTTGAAGPYQIMPDLVKKYSAAAGHPLDPMNPEDGKAMANQVLADARKRYGNNEAAIVAYYNGGHRAGDAVAAGKNPPVETQAYLYRYNQMKGQQGPGNDVVAGPGGQAPAPMAPPARGGPEAFLDPSRKIQMPVGVLGSSNPVATKQYEEDRAQARAEISDRMKSDKNVDFAMKLRDAIESNRGKTYTGAGAKAQMKVDEVTGFFGAADDPRYQNTKAFENTMVDIVQNKAKLLGTNPSDSDRDFISSGLPTVNASSQQREFALARLETLANRQVDKNKTVAKMVRDGYSVQDADEAYNSWDVQRVAVENARYKEHLARGGKRGEMPPENPTQAGSAPPAPPAGALPSAISAAQAAPPGAPPPQRPPTGPDPTAPQGFWGKAADAAGDVGRSIAALPQSAMAVPQAANDTLRNVGRGAEELVGMGDRKADMAAVTAQELRRKQDSFYNQARAFTDITANPLSYLGGGATSIAKLAGIAGVQSLLQPAESFTQQVVEGAKGAAIGAFLGGLTKLLPSTGSDVAGVTKGMGEFPSVKPTSAQMNPNSLEARLAAGLGVNDAAAMKQVQGLTKDLASKAGMKTSTITPETIAATKKELGDQFDTIFTGRPGQTMTRVATNTQADLKQGIDRAMSGPATRSTQDMNAILNSQDAPALQRLYASIQDTANPMNIRIKDLHEAWKEVGAVAQDPQAARAVRDMLESTMEKVIGRDKLALFKDTSLKYGNLNDIERVYAGAAGVGEGKASAFLSPNAIKGADPSMVPGAAMDQARAYIKATGMKEGKVPIIQPETSIVGAATALGKKAAGPVINALDWANKAASNAPTSVKRIVETLRRPTFANIKAGRQEEQENAP